MKLGWACLVAHIWPLLICLTCCRCVCLHLMTRMCCICALAVAVCDVCCLYRVSWILPSSAVANSSVIRDYLRLVLWILNEYEMSDGLLGFVEQSSTWYREVRRLNYKFVFRFVFFNWELVETLNFIGLGNPGGNSNCLLSFSHLKLDDKAVPLCKGWSIQILLSVRFFYTSRAFRDRKFVFASAIFIAHLRLFAIWLRSSTSKDQQRA